MSGVPHPTRLEIRRNQLEQLRRLIQTIVPANPFHTARLRAAGIDPEVASLEDFAMRFPLTTKRELTEDHRANPPYGTNLTFPLERYTRLHQTSGSTGHPIRWLDTPESWGWMVDNWAEVFRAAGVGAGDRILFAFSFGPFLGFWTAFEAGQRLGALCLPAGGLSSEARAAMLAENQVTALCCTPSYALRLAEVGRQEQIDPGQLRLRRIVVAGEPGGSIPATRSRIEELWPGARVFDHHGMTEVGPVTFQCPQQPGVLHVLEPGFIAEVINPETGLAVGPAQIGELVLSSLGRIGSPLLRYRTGDMVRPRCAPGDAGAEPCGCGRSQLALEGGILGRADDMLIVRGVNVFPSAIEETIRSLGGVAEFRVTVSREQELTQLQMHVEAEPEHRDPVGLAQRLEKALASRFALRIPVTPVPPGALPRYEMKSRRWVKA